MAEHDKEIDKKTLSEVWGLVLLRGILLILVGIIFLIRPYSSLMFIVMVMGAFWFIDGIATIFKSTFGPKEGKHWIWGLFVGSIGTIAGLVVFSQPLLSTILTSTFLVYFLGFAAIISGISSIANGVRLRKEIDHEWSMILGGAISLLLGFLLLAHPVFSIAVVIVYLGITAIIGGAALTAYAFQLRKLSQQG